MRSLDDEILIKRYEDTILAAADTLETAHLLIVKMRSDIFQLYQIANKNAGMEPWFADFMKVLDGYKQMEQ